MERHTKEVLKRKRIANPVNAPRSRAHSKSQSSRTTDTDSDFSSRSVDPRDQHFLRDRSLSTASTVAKKSKLSGTAVKASASLAAASAGGSSGRRSTLATASSSTAPRSFDETASSSLPPSSASSLPLTDLSTSSTSRRTTSRSSNSLKGTSTTTIASASAVSVSAESLRRRSSAATPEVGPTTLTVNSDLLSPSSLSSGAELAASNQTTTGDSGSHSSSSNTSTRQLSSLLNFFPGLETSRRLTRSLTKKLKPTSSHPHRNDQDDDSDTAEGLATSSKAAGRPASTSSTLKKQHRSDFAKKSTALPKKAPPAPPKNMDSTTTTSGGASSGSSRARRSTGNASVNMGAALASGKDLNSNHPGATAVVAKETAATHHHDANASQLLHNNGHNIDRAPEHHHQKNVLADLASSSTDSLDNSIGTPTATTPGAAAAAAAGAGGRLHQLFESHRSSIPIHIFGALGPRMQTLLGRYQTHTGSSGVAASSSGGAGGGVVSRWDSLLVAMQKHDDLSAQLQGLIELCNLLVMSNEDTLGTSFPVKEVVRCLIKLLQIEHNFDIMTHACRALTYLMEALPRVTIHVTDAVPYLLEKLQRVECIDVAEQALAALELLSRRHGKNILNAGGVNACLQYIDFLSTSSQRSALQIVANCCLHTTSEDFVFLQDSLSNLSQRLTTQDKKTVELLCQTFTRLVDNYVSDAEKLKLLCDHGLLENTQQLIITSPPLLNSNTLCSVIRMLHLLCRQCSDVAVRLTHLNVVAALRILLLGSLDPQATNSELLARTPQEMFELVVLIGELWPALPNDGLFEVDVWLKSSSPLSNEHILWTWKDEKGMWRPFMHVDNRILETAYQSKEEEITLSTMGQTFTMDLLNMIQINEETGHSHPIQRRVASSSSSPAHKKSSSKHTSANASQPAPPPKDARLDLLKSHPKLYEEFIRCLFPVLYEIYTSVAGPAVRYESLRTLLRMMYHCDAVILKDVLKKHSISSLIAGILNSQDLKTVVVALQLTRVLIDKQQDVFVIHFKREGVTHQLAKLSSGAFNLAISGTNQISQSAPNLTHMAQAAAASTSSFLAPGGGAPGASYVVVSTGGAHSSGTAYHQYTSHGAAAPATVVYSPQDFAAYYAATSPAALGFNATAAVSAPPPLIVTTTSTASNDTAPKRPPLPAKTEFATERSAAAVKKRGSAHISATGAAGGSTISKHASNSNASSSSSSSDKSKSLRLRSRAASTDAVTAAAALSTKHQSAQPAASSRSSQQQQASNNAPATSSSRHQNAVASAALQQQQSASSSSGGSAFLGSSFLSSLSLPRWAKPQATASAATANRHHAGTPGGSRKQQAATSSGGAFAPPPLTTVASTSTLAQSVTSNSFNSVKATSWIKEQAKAIISKYFSINAEHEGEEALLQKLTEIAVSLKNGEVNSLQQLISVLNTDVSCFEILQSGLVPAMVEFFTAETLHSNISRPDRLRQTAEAFFQARVELNSEGVPTVFLPTDQTLARKFVQKLNVCVSQLEQLPVKVHDFAFGTGHGHHGQSSDALRGLNALRFLHTQQIKCLLQRHPEEKMLRQWRRGPIKVDPLAQISTIERYLVNRGYGRYKPSSNDEMCSEDENDTSGDEDSDEPAVHQSQSTEPATDGLHRLQLSINDRQLPADLSIYQAVKQYGLHGSQASSDWLGPEIWVNTHVIYYRMVQDTKLNENSHQGSDGSSKSIKHAGVKNRAKDKAHLKPVLDPKDIEMKPVVDPLMQYLHAKLPVEFSDPSSDCLNLLRIFFGLSRYWWSAFKDVLVKEHFSPLTISDFHNSKVGGKISRQLQDPLMLIAGQIPPWIEQLAFACPFMCSFEIRMALFYVLSLDRDRALQRLLENFFDTNHTSTSERLTPRLERRKVIISREDILRQAEAVFSSIENSRAILEVQYENEVGTGLGPTLEFYALVSKNLQRHNLQLWRGDAQKREDDKDNNTDELLVANSRGLYALPLGRHVKQAQLDKLKSRFKLIGKLLARSLLDGRILDLPLSALFYKWLLKEENTLGLADLADLDPTLCSSLQYLVGQLHKSRLGGKHYFEAKSNIEALELDFTFPGQHSVELIKGGKDTSVTLDNLQQYVDLVVHWMLRAGVTRQMEMMREAFDVILSLKHLKLFLPEEMDQLFCGARSDVEPWEQSMLRQSIHPDHGYNHDSPQIRWLIEIMSEYDQQHRRLFLQFVTGSPRLPVGGLKNLNPPFTAVRKHDGGLLADEHLPSVMTCVNYLKLPEYSAKDVMARRFLTAITCGCFSFHLS